MKLKEFVNDNSISYLIFPDNRKVPVNETYDEDWNDLADNEVEIIKVKEKLICFSGGKFHSSWGEAKALLIKPKSRKEHKHGKQIN